MELIIANTVDAYRDSVALIQDPDLKEHEILDSYYLQDRSLLWCGSHKVVVTSRPIDPAHISYLRTTLGYQCLEAYAPRECTDSLCEDILRDTQLRAQLAGRLRNCGQVPLITFQASPQVCAVADALRRDGVDIVTPECPPPDLMWVRDYLDSKSGFRRFFTSIADKVHGVRLPEGAVAVTCHEAARMAARFLSQGKGALCKPNNSQGGVGFLILQPGDIAGPPPAIAAEIQRRLEADSQMRADVIVVEELVPIDRSIGGGSPSLEMWVPSDPTRDVEFMYLCGQILTPTGYFYGVEMYRDVLDAELQKTLEQAGITVAREMRRLGYVGIFDMDLVAGQDGELYAVEVNTRRTGGTHAHEAALALYGPRYWERAAVICNNELRFAGPRLSFEDTRAALEPVLYPIAGGPEGIVLTIVTSLATNRLGYLSLASTIERAREIEARMQELLVAHGCELLAV